MNARRAVAVSALLLAAAACGASSPVAVPSSPTTTSASPTASPTPSLTPSPTPSPKPTALPSRTRSPSPRPSATRTSPRPRRTSPAPVPTSPKPRPLPAGARSLFVLGDSVLISAEPYVRAALNGWVVTYDAVGSRRLPQGIDVLRARRAEIGRVVVIQQGDNYIAAEGSFATQIDEAMRVLKGTSRVVWLTVAEKWPSRVEINRQIRAAAARWPTIVVGDWARLVAAHPEYAGDMLHLSPAGRQAIARLIDQCVGPAPA